MDGLLVIDKPVGPTSHDVVARLRRTLEEKRVGHTGTLDPAATGVLPLVVGRATRLARFLSSAVKGYRATVRLGVSTDTYDATGIEQSRHEGPLPDRAAIERALDAFRGPFLQTPPAYSAKKVDGERSHRIARRASANQGTAERPDAAGVTTSRIAIVGLDGSRLDLDLECSAGFYVRSLAHDLGERLGVGAHLEALRRTRSGDLTLADAVPLAAVDGRRDLAVAAMIPMRRMLPALPAVLLTADGVRLARHGRVLAPGAGLATPRPGSGAGADVPACVRLIDPEGELVGLGRPAGVAGEWHPFVVLASDLM
jgi:tRNA pseudouridine55 synthase